jgi:hypothetical protein
MTDAADAALVSRATVHRWMHDPVFLAAFNGRRSEAVASVRANLLRLQDKALSAVEDAIDSGDSRVALAVLRGAGLLDGQAQHFGSDDPEQIAKGQRAAAREQEMWDRLSL